MPIGLRKNTVKHIRPKLVENTGSRLLPHHQAAKRRISSWVGDDQRIPGVVCFLVSSIFDDIQISKYGNWLGGAESLAPRTWCQAEIDSLTTALVYLTSVAHDMQ